MSWFHRHVNPKYLLTIITLITATFPCVCFQISRNNHRPLPISNNKVKTSSFQSLFLLPLQSSEPEQKTIKLLQQFDNSEKEARSLQMSSKNHGAKESVGKTILSLIGSTTSAVVAGTFFLVLAWQRDALMVTFFMGAITNGVLSKVLKKIIDQSRPPELNTQTMKLKPSDGGMPSSHAMSLGFIGTFTGLSLAWTRIPLVLYIIISLVYRVEAKLHTWEQIAVGLTVGSSFGALWWNLCGGSEIFGLHIDLLTWTTNNFLDTETGLLPWYGLAVPATLGLVVVGSFERRISQWIRKQNKTE